MTFLSLTVHKVRSEIFLCVVRYRYWGLRSPISFYGGVYDVELREKKKEKKFSCKFLRYENKHMKIGSQRVVCIEPSYYPTVIPL